MGALSISTPHVRRTPGAAGAPAPLKAIGGRRVLRRLGAGGMSEVYLAYDQERHAPVAVKVLADSLTRANSTEGPKLRDAIATADVAGVTGRLKMNAKRNVDKPAVIEEVVFKDGDVQFVYKTTINP